MTTADRPLLRVVPAIGVALHWVGFVVAAWQGPTWVAHTPLAPLPLQELTGIAIGIGTLVPLAVAHLGAATAGHGGPYYPLGAELWGGQAVDTAWLAAAPFLFAHRAAAKSGTSGAGR